MGWVLFAAIWLALTVGFVLGAMWAGIQHRNREADRAAAARYARIHHWGRA